MKGKSYSADLRTQALRAVETGSTINEVCRAKKIAEPTLRRWIRQLGRMRVNECLRIQEQETKNQELRKLLFDTLLVNRTLESPFVLNPIQRPPSPSASVAGSTSSFSR